MSLLFTILLLLLLGIVFVQDMKYRAVSWLLFPALLMVMTLLNISQISSDDFFFNTGMNLFLLLVIFLLVTTYFSIKYRKFVNISKDLIGWGDLLFFLCLTSFFSPMNFILFFTSSLLLITLAAGIFILFTKEKTLQIPLAGLQAVLLIVLVVLNFSIPVFKLNTDEWVILLL